MNEALRDIGQRALNTFCQTLLAAVSFSGALRGVEDVHWWSSLSVALMATILSALQNIAKWTARENSE